MKIRIGFVSNSSSSSFIAYGFKVPPGTNLKDILSDEGKKIVKDFCENCGYWDVAELENPPDSLLYEAFGFYDIAEVDVYGLLDSDDVTDIGTAFVACCYENGKEIKPTNNLEEFENKTKEQLHKFFRSEDRELSWFDVHTFIY